MGIVANRAGKVNEQDFGILRRSKKSQPPNGDCLNLQLSLRYSVSGGFCLLNTGGLHKCSIHRIHPLSVFRAVPSATAISDVAVLRSKTTHRNHSLSFRIKVRRSRLFRNRSHWYHSFYEKQTVYTSYVNSIIQIGNYQVDCAPIGITLS